MYVTSVLFVLTFFQYRAPPLKSKRAITREKYSPLVQRKVRQASPSSNSNFSSNSTTGSASSSASSTRHTSQSQQEQSNRLSKSGCKCPVHLVHQPAFSIFYCHKNIRYKANWLLFVRFTVWAFSIKGLN